VSPSGQADLSVVIVNYNVSDLVLEAVASLQRQKFAAPDGRAGRLEIIVIDNASSPEDVARLERLPSCVVLVKNAVNVGFATATNEGIRRASGRYVCFLNPDTMVLDGALDALLHYLYRHPEVGAVGPKIWADEQRTFLMPPCDPPTLSFLLSQFTGTAFPTWGKVHTRQCHRHFLRFWQSQTPLEMPMLSGACIVTSRAVVDRTGSFDPHYFMYYEDADWCRRVRRAGYRVALVPDAEIVHYYNQSAKRDPQGAQAHGRSSQARFVKVHYGVPGLLLYRAAQAMSHGVASWRGPTAAHQVIDLGRCTAPLRLSVTNDVPTHEIMLQIGYDCRFLPSVATFIGRPEFQFSQPLWDWMQPGRYYARMVDPKTLRPLALWSWEKA
jgi:GT2 family glycosyltransferase